MNFRPLLSILVEKRCLIPHAGACINICQRFWQCPINLKVLMPIGVGVVFLISLIWSALEVVSSGCGPLLNSVSSGCGPLWVVISLCCGPLSCVVSLGWGPLLGALELYYGSLSSRKNTNNKSSGFFLSKVPSWKNENANAIQPGRTEFLLLFQTSLHDLIKNGRG